MRVVWIHPEAEFELDQQALWYDDRQQGLGIEFRDAFRECIERILDFPDSGSPAPLQTRRRKLKRFPHSVFYKTYEDSILVVAIAHTRRRENYWTSRLD